MGRKQWYSSLIIILLASKWEMLQAGKYYRRLRQPALHVTAKAMIHPVTVFLYLPMKNKFIFLTGLINTLMFLMSVNYPGKHQRMLPILNYHMQYLGLFHHHAV